MKKAVNKVPFFCFLAILMVGYLDHKKYSDTTLLITVALVIISLASFIYGLKKEHKIANTKLYLLSGCIIVSIIVAVYMYLK